MRVTNVDVVVTGPDGKPVTGLTRDDFRIFENGEEKQASNFLEVRSSVAVGSLTPAGAEKETAQSFNEDFRRRDITVFVDNAALHPLRRNQILPQLRRFLETSVRSGDTVGIVVWNRSLKIELEPTGDRERIREALASLEGRTALGGEDAAAKEELYRELAWMVRAYADIDKKPAWSTGVTAVRIYAMQRASSVRQRVEAVKSLLAWRRGFDGRKIMVLLTAELPMNPGEEMFHYLDSIRDSFDFASPMASSEAREFEIPSLITEIAAAANSSGVTLYPIDAAGKDSGMPARDASVMPVLTPAGKIEQARSMDTLRSVAEETGGIALSGSDNWKLAFDTIANDLESYYSIGYRASGEPEDRMKRIEVRLRDGRYKVRTRSAVVERSVTSEMHDAVAANLFRPSTANDLTVRATAGSAVPQSEEAVLVPVSVTIPMDELTLIPDGDDLTGRVAIFAAFLRSDGAVSKVAQQPGVIRFPADSLAGRKELTLKIDVTMDGQTDGISVGVMDEFSRATGFAAVKLQ